MLEEGRLGKGKWMMMIALQTTYIQASHLRHDNFLGRLVRLELTDLVALGLDEGVEFLLGGHGLMWWWSREEEETSRLLIVGCKGQFRE